MLLKKIYSLLLILFLILTIYSIPITTLRNKKVLRTNLEIKNVTIPTTKIYLLNKDNYLVQTEVPLEGNKLEDKIKNIIEYLKEDNDSLKDNLKGYIPRYAKLINIKIDSNKIILNFTKTILSNKENRDIIITGIVKSLLELKEIEKVSFLIEDKEYRELKKEYDKYITINSNYNYHNRNNISKVVIYYLDNTYNNFIPVTYYMNNNKEKIEIIIEELKNNPSNLISFISNNLELLDYKEEENVLSLNFNSYLLNKNEKVTETILNEISYSVFDNYDVNMVMFLINNQELKYIMK